MAAARHTIPLPLPLSCTLSSLPHGSYPLSSQTRRFIVCYVTLRYVTLYLLTYPTILAWHSRHATACSELRPAPTCPRSAPTMHRDQSRTIANIAIRNLPALSFLNFSHSFPKPTTIRLDLSGARILAGNLSNLRSETLDFTQA